MSNIPLTKPVNEVHVNDKAEASRTFFNQIKWDDILRSGVLLQAKDHQLLERAQTNLAVVLDNEQDSKDFANILIKIADSSQNNIVIQQYVFTRVEEILGLGADISDMDNDAFGSKHCKLFFVPGTKKIIDGPFLRAIKSEDNYLQRAAAIGLASLFTSGTGDISSLVSWVNSKFLASTQGHNSVWEMALPTLLVMVRSSEVRKVFIENNGLFNVVSKLNEIGANGNAQFIYDLSFVIWTLSLAQEIDTRAFLSSGAIATLTDFLGKSPSRKVTRVIVAALKNLAGTGNDDILTEMFSSSLEKVLDNLMQSSTVKNSTDIEFDSDVKSLNDILLKNYRDLSTFDRYQSEVQSGALRWGVVHTEKFWRENVKHIEVNEFKLLKLLIQLLESTDPVIVGIALYDIGEFARFYPNGRVVVSKLGGKELAMKKISDDDPTIRRYALQAVSKIMVTNWEFMK